MVIRALVALLASLPAFAVAWGVSEGERVFVLYREPKWTVSVFLIAALWIVGAWRRPSLWTWGEVRDVLRLPAVICGGSWLLWATLTGFWSLVPELFAYEVSRLWILSATAFLLLIACRRDASLQRWIEGGLIVGTAGVTVVGLAQAGGWFPALNSALPSINPQFGADHASLMGYKNPAALAVVGQLFLLVGASLRVSNPAAKLGLGFLAVVEVGYLASLHSRTAYLALLVGILATALLFSLRPGIEGSRKNRLKGWFLLLAAPLFFIAAILSDPGTAARFRSIGPHLSLEAYLESDRGAYLLNTLNMAAHHPAGVGLGQWQAYYPVFRKHQRDRSFDETFQVRRAHGDHVQILGETGVPGIVLWLAFLGALLYGAVRAYWRETSTESLFVAVQGTVLVAAMATDYVVEMPYHKLLWTLVVVLTVRRALPAAPEAETAPEDGTPQRVPWQAQAVALIVPGVVTLTALILVVGSARELRKAQLGAEIQRRHGLVVEAIRSSGQVERRTLEDLLRLGAAYEALPGWSKIAHRDHLALAHAAQLLEQGDEAERHARRALALHPYSPKTLRFMSTVTRGETSRAWREAASYVLHEATDGFGVEYPESLP